MWDSIIHPHPQIIMMMIGPFDKEWNKALQQRQKLKNLIIIITKVNDDDHDDVYLETGQVGEGVLLDRAESIVVQMQLDQLAQVG